MIPLISRNMYAASKQPRSTSKSPPKTPDSKKNADASVPHGPEIINCMLISVIVQLRHVRLVKRYRCEAIECCITWAIEDCTYVGCV